MVFLLKIASFLLNLLPRGTSLALGEWLGRACFVLMSGRRAVALENLRLAYGDAMDEAARQNLIRRNFEHYGKTVIEFLQAVNWDRQRYAQSVTVHGYEHYKALKDQGLGGILLASHSGNWEVTIADAASRGVPLDVVVKRSKSAYLEKVLSWYRTKTGMGLIYETGTAGDILKSVASGRFVAFVFDQFMGPPVGIPATFFGQPAGTPVALALLTEKREIPIIPIEIYRDEKGGLHTVVSPPIVYPELSENRGTRLFQKTQLYNDILEANVRRRPEQWNWIHRRWKPYVGESRWKNKLALTGATVALALVLAGCASRGPISSTVTPSETGIALPPDPTIEAPAIQTVEQTGKLNDGIQVALKETSVPAEEPAVAPEPKAKKKKQVEKRPPAVKKSVVEIANVDRIPFDVGERMVMDLTFLALPAGTATFEVRQGPTMAGRPTTLLWGNVLSSKLVDHLYHVDNTIESYVDSQGLFPYKFLLHMVETPQTKETRVAFDHTKSKAYYWAKRISAKYGNMDVDRQDAVPALTKDLWSAFYFARTLNYELKKTMQVPVYENGQNMVAELTPVANELVRTKAGVFQCWKINLQLKLNNVLRPSGELFIWLSDDNKRYLVKVDLKLQLGALYGHLVQVRERL